MFRSICCVLLVSFSSVMGLASSCNKPSATSGAGFTCNPYQKCDAFFCLWETQCEYYGGDGSTVETAKDIVSEFADQEEAQLKLSTRFYAEKFQLSDEQGLKLAKVIHDYRLLKTRDSSEVAAFAQKLYGLNTKEIVSALGKAQIGDDVQLNELIDQAAKNFNTSPKNMRTIVKYMHGNALNEAGILID